VCDRWNSSFDAFLSDMGEAPTVKHTIDRINAAKGYEPENCRWATHFEQVNNRRGALGENAVRFIRAHPQLKLRELAAKYSVTETTISSVRTGRTWSHVK
jgi:hypothetical protein